MKKLKNINVLAPILMVTAIVLSLYLAYFRENEVTDSVVEVEKTYVTSLFDDSKVQSVEIIMDESSWQEMLDNALAEQYYVCDLIVNGVTYKNVGIRPKGNTSLSMVASNDTTDRYSFKIDFGKYVEGQTCDGLDVLILNNLMSDATYMKEYLAYDLFRFMDVNASLTSFTEVKVNGQEWGLYLALEGVEESFAQREYGYSHGNLYKPESDSVEGGGGAGKEGGFGGFSSSGKGADLVYTDNDEENYSDIFDNAVFDVDAEDKARVIEALRHINEGTDLEQYVDVDQMLRYIAVNVVLVNLDSYFGTMLHNYYLYEENGQLAMVPWDYNLAFAGFQGGSAEGAVNLAIDTVVSGAKLEDRPMLAKLLEVEEYKERYHEYLEQIVTEYFESGYFVNKLKYVDSLISPYVESDATAFYSYAEYKTAVDTLQTFGLLRSESIKGQLEGTIPSTEEGQKANSSSLIDASSINLSDMGTMMGGGKGGANMPQMPAGNFERPEGENFEMPEGGFGRPQGEGFEMPEGGFERPHGEGFEMPEDGFGRPQGENFERPENMGEKGRNDTSQRPQGGMQMENANRVSTQYTTKDISVIIISFVVIIIAMGFVKIYKKRKYRSK